MPARLLHILSLAIFGLAVSLPIQAADKPNILVIWGDDIGIWNISRYSMGMMGFQTPNIDRIAKEGMIFTDYYVEQSCTVSFTVDQIMEPLYHEQ
jgi:arylsulfatase